MIVALSGVLGCQTAREPVAVHTVIETRWLLIRNPSVSDVRSEPEYLWVEEHNVPITKLIPRTYAIVVTPDMVARYGLPPDGGTISPLQTRRLVTHPITGEILFVLEPEP